MQIEILPTDLHHQKVGPIDVRLPGIMQLDLQLDGEIIVHSRVTTGFTTKNIEKAMQSRPWQVGMPYADRVDPENAIFGEMVFAMAVESLLGVVVPERGQVIRTLMCELGRISNHLRFLTRLAIAVQSETAVHYLLRDRERILDLFELQSGARFSSNFFCFGGVGFDVSDGFVEKVQEICDLLTVRVNEYDGLFKVNYGFISRATGTAVIDCKSAKKIGMTGPNARASGLDFDLRSKFPYSAYNQIDIYSDAHSDLASRLNGDLYSRYLVRANEISQSVLLLRQLTTLIKPGDVVSPLLKQRVEYPMGEAYACIESPRGLLGCSVVSSGDLHPLRIQFNTPSTIAILAAEQALRGESIEDLSLILASLDISVAEVDR